jgi:hypothetical protein
LGYFQLSPACLNLSTIIADGKECAMSKRRRFKQSVPLKDRLASFAKDVRAKASLTPPGPERTDLIRRAQQADAAALLDGWINSPGLQPPK